MDGAKPNQPASLALVYEEHWRYVWKCVRKMGVHDHRIEDVVQDVFLVVGERLADFEGRSSMRTWLYGIAFRVVQEDHRRRQREGRPAPTQTVEGTTPEQQTELVEAARLLHTLLGELEEEQRLAIMLSEFDGMEVAQIAEHTGVSVNTVYSRLRLGRQKLERGVARHRARIQREMGAKKVVNG